MTVDNEGPSDNDLLNEILSDETPDTPVVAEQVEQVEATEQPLTTEEVTTEATAEKPAVDDNAPQVPSWRVREINEEKRALAAERDALLAERANWQRQPAQERPKAEAEKSSRPDPLLDPEGYANAIRQELRDEALNDRREESLQRAAESKPEEFKEAYAAAQKVVDPALRARMQNTRDPGKELLKWHREQKVKAEVGDDLEAYVERKVQERIAAKAPAAQTQQTNGRPRVDLPPSLNGASRANTTLKAAVEDVPDDQLFQELTG